MAVDTTGEAGGAAGGAYEPGGVGAGLIGLVAHSVTVTVTVVGAAQAAGRQVRLRYTKIAGSLTVVRDDSADQRGNCEELEGEHGGSGKWMGVGMR